MGATGFQRLSLYFACFFILMGIGLLSGSAWAQLRLSESDVITIVLRQNLEVLARSYDPKVAETLITQVKSQFDTLINGDAGYRLDQGDKTSIVFGTDNRQILYRARASKRLPYGVEGAVSLSNQHDSTNSAFATDPDFFETRLVFEARGALLRNRFGKSDQGEIHIAEAQKEVTTQKTLQNVEEEVYRAVISYWNLVAAYQYLDLAKKFLGRGQNFFNATRQKRVIGLSEDPDVLAAEVLVIQRKTEILRAENLLTDFQKRLLNDLNLRDSLTVIPKEDLKFQPKPFTRQEAMEVALRNRNDYLALLEDAKSKDIEIVVAKDQKWPSLDLVTSLELNSVDPDYGQALQETFSAQNPNWFIGAEFGLSFENRLAKSALQRGELEKAQLLVEIKQLENDIALQIDEIIREYILQNKESRDFFHIADLQRRKLDIELKNYSLGRSSSDIIVRFETDWLDAERSLLGANLRQVLARVDMRHVVSTLIPDKTQDHNP
jgi:outer membrane protein TolC